jgi:nitroreductase
MVANPYVRAGLSVEENEEIIGFIYVGMPVQEMPAPPLVTVEKFFKPWPAK